MKHKRFVGVISEIDAMGVVPLGFYNEKGSLVRIQRVLQRQQKRGRHTCYICQSGLEIVCLWRDYRSGRWYLQ